MSWCDPTDPDYVKSLAATRFWNFHVIGKVTWFYSFRNRLLDAYRVNRHMTFGLAGLWRLIGFPSDMHTLLCEKGNRKKYIFMKRRDITAIRIHFLLNSNQFLLTTNFLTNFEPPPPAMDPTPGVRLAAAWLLDGVCSTAHWLDEDLNPIESDGQGRQPQGATYCVALIINH